MPVIAFTQEMGSLAKDVALRLAEEMKLDTLRHEVVELSHAGAPLGERRSVVVEHRVMCGTGEAVEQLALAPDIAQEQLFGLAVDGNQPISQVGQRGGRRRQFPAPLTVPAKWFKG